MNRKQKYETRFSNGNKIQTLYILQNGNTDQYKIGITDNLNRRLSQLQTGCPEELRVVKLWTHYQRKVIKKYEMVLHRYYEKCGCRIRKNGEWFRLCRPDLDFLCKPNSIAEQNDLIDIILDMM